MIAVQKTELFKSPIANHQYPLPNIRHQTQITNHQSPITNHKSQITNHKHSSCFGACFASGNFVLRFSITQLPNYPITKSQDPGVPKDARFCQLLIANCQLPIYTK
jgi:hypothetical protein